MGRRCQIKAKSLRRSIIQLVCANKMYIVTCADSNKNYRKPNFDNDQHFKTIFVFGESKYTKLKVVHKKRCA